MNLLALAAVAAAVAVFPVASAPGLVVSQAGTLYVSGTPIGRGTEPAWSPDGRRIAFVRGGELHVVAADGRGDRRLTRGGAAASSPAWSPDGRTIAFAAGRDILTVRVADGKLTNLTHSRKPWLGNYTPAFSPTGKLIAFARNTDAFNSDIFLMTTRGTIVRRLTHSIGTDSRLGEEHGPAWSPDGRTLVYVSNRVGRSWELFRIGVDGRGERRLTHTSSAHYNENAPRYIENGRRILYAHDGLIATIAADGSDIEELGAGTSADLR